MGEEGRGKKEGRGEGKEVLTLFAGLDESRDGCRLCLRSLSLGHLVHGHGLHASSLVPCRRDRVHATVRSSVGVLLRLGCILSLYLT